MRDIRQASLSVALVAAAGISFCSARAQSVQLSGAVTVSGNTILRDGRPWTAHGFFQIAFVKPPAITDKVLSFNIAAADYTPAEYPEMRAVGADSVRMQVSQPGLDPEDPLFSASLLHDSIAAVQAAREAGLTVILNVQDELAAGQGTSTEAKLPNAATRRVWRELAPAFAHDRGVLYELLNEPQLETSAANWQAWAAAMNQTIRTVRDAGAINVVVADGLEFAEQLSGAPALQDPLGQVIYADHPYAHAAAGQTQAAWDAKFGNFARNHPVMITEWAPAYFCDDQTATSTVSFFHYLQARHIGLEIGTWDWKSAKFGSAVYDFPNSRFSRFVASSGMLACHSTGFGPGVTLETWYRTGVPPDAPL